MPSYLNYWLDCGGCGLIVLNKYGMVVGGAPYFLKFLYGKYLREELGNRHYRLENIDE